jgi:hypothetical protein
MRLLALPRFISGNWNTLVCNPKTGELEEHGNGQTLLIGGEYCEKVFPTDRQLKRISRDIDSYLKERMTEKND